MSLNKIPETQEALVLNDNHIAIIGLGYVWLPLGYNFAKVGYEVTGVDLSEKKIQELKQGIDTTEEIGTAISEVSMNYTSDIGEINSAKIIIVAVPTPVNSDKTPDYWPLIGASTAIGKVLQKWQVVCYESTVSPGSTEEVCLPLLEKFSGLKCPEDFTIGYSPERINPGDKKHTLTSIVKVVSGIDKDTTDLLVNTYERIIIAWVHRAPNIKTAEAAKIMENTQRDVNIALMNSFALYCQVEGINPYDVLEAAGTKWNFQPFRPGLVGGHCIWVDPYYLGSRSEKKWYKFELLDLSRKINDAVAKDVAQRMIKMLAKAKHNLSESTVLILGLTFKPDVPDFRNSKIADTIKELKDYGINIVGYDPYSSSLTSDDTEELHLIPSEILTELGTWKFTWVIFAQDHKEFNHINIHELLTNDGVMFDVKGKYRNEEFPFYAHL